MDKNHETLSSCWKSLNLDQFKDSKYLVYLSPQPILNSEYVKSLNIQKPSEETLKKLKTLGLGVVGVAVGVSMTAASGGVLGAVVFPSITSASSALVLTPITKLFTGEDMSMTDVGNKAVVYGVVGAVAAPLGYGISELANGYSDFTQLCFSVFASSSTGAVSGALSDFFNNQHSTNDSMINAAKFGAVLGTVGGVTGKFASGLSNQFESTFGRILTRVGVQGASAAATDAGIQYHQTGKVDLDQTIINAGGQVVLAATAEMSAARAQKIAANADSHRRIDRDLKSGKITVQVADELKLNLQKINEHPEDFSRKRTGDSKMHKLDNRNKSMRGDQVAVTVGDRWGQGRAIYENIDDSYVYLDYTPDHNYKDCQVTMKGKIPDPISGLKAMKFGGIMQYFEDGKDFKHFEDNKNIQEMFFLTDNVYMRRFAPSLMHKL